MKGITRKEFAEAVAAGIASVQHLYREIDRMIATLRASLLQEPDALVLIRGALGKAATAKDLNRVVLRNEYSLLFEPAAEEEELEADDKTDEADETEETDENEDLDDAEDMSPGKRSRAVEIEPDKAFLVVRVLLMDARSSAEFEPAVQYAVLSDWGLGMSGVKPKDGQPFTVRRYMLRRIPRVLGPKADLTKRLVTTVKILGKGRGIKGAADRRLSCRIPGGLQSVPLYDLDDPAALDKLASEMKDHWAKVVVP